MDNMRFEEKSKHFNFTDLENQKFNRLTVLGYAGKLNKNHLWYCLCDCGNVKKYSSGNLKSGHTKSCGCLRKECFIKHGKWGNSEYRSYNHAQQRCNNPNSNNYKNYGGRGIEFRFNSFEEFYSELGDKPEPKKDYSIERIDNDGHYEKGNVKWASTYEQDRNKRVNHWINFRNEIKCLEDWAKEVGINPKTISNRLNLNWCKECAMSILPRKGKCIHRM